jgi:hypothetical protein
MDNLKKCIKIIPFLWIIMDNQENSIRVEKFTTYVLK